MPCPWLAWALKIPWKSTVSLKVLENWKKIRISLKSPWIVLKAPWTKITLIIKEKVFCVFFLWCSRHDSSFSVIWSSQGTVPSWGDGIAISSPPPPLPTDLKCLYFISFYVKLQEKQVLEKLILVLEKSLIFPHKFCMKSFAVSVPQVRVHT